MKNFNLMFNENDSFVKKAAKTLLIQATITVTVVVFSWMLLSVSHFLM